MHTTCEGYSQVISQFDQFKNLDKKGCKNIIMDEQKRCTTKYYRDVYGAELPVSSFWDASKCRRLTREVLQLIEHEAKLGVTKVGWLDPSAKLMGCSYMEAGEWIFVRCSEIRHPFDIISAVLHEIAHHMADNCLHGMGCTDQHCAVWTECARILGAVFAVGFFIKGFNDSYA